MHDFNTDAFCGQGPMQDPVVLLQSTVRKWSSHERSFSSFNLVVGAVALD